MILTADAVPGYLQERAALRDRVDTTSLDVAEVGDGNLNQVFLCADNAGRRLVLKQSLPYVRLVGPDWPMTQDRATREAHALREHHRLSPGNVCELLDYDDARYVLALQDLSDHVVLRTRLNEGGSAAGVGNRMGRYVADYGFGTSYFAMGEECWRHAAAETVNSELCALTEDLVFTEPYLGAERNSISDQIRPTVDRLMADPAWVSAAMTMKRRFVTRAESLLHGDLHTGSIFVRGEEESLSAKAFDSEFAFYGPLGFDLGLLWANLVMAAVRARVLGEPDRARSLLGQVSASWYAMTARFGELWPHRLTPDKHPDICLDLWQRDLMDDAFGFAGCEISRRIVGLAKVSDIESLPPDQHTEAATDALAIGRELLVRRSELDWDALGVLVLGESG